MSGLLRRVGLDPYTVFRVFKYIIYTFDHDQLVFS